MNAASDFTLLAAAYSASIVWCLALMLPSRPFGMRERLEPSKPDVADLGDITVLIPARDEATTIQRTLVAVGDQSGAAPVVIVDDGGFKARKSTNLFQNFAANENTSACRRGGSAGN